MASNASRGGRDFRVAALFEALRASEQQGDAPADWGRFYEEGHPGGFLGPVALGASAGLGLRAARRLRRGELLLLERSWALGPRGAEVPEASAQLVSACCRKLRDAATPQLEKAVFRCLHPGEGGRDEGFRQSIFNEYLRHLKCGARSESSDLGPVTERVGAIVKANSRKTEHWDPWTLLLRDTEAVGGLWLVASLFNHSCLGNVVITYANNKDGSVALVARAAVDIEKDEELLHTYVYPFDTVLERRSRLQASYGFSCTCTRCSLEAPHAEAAGRLADNLESELQHFSAARGKGARPSDMAAVVKKMRSALARIDDAAESLPADSRQMWRSQFLWGDHGLAMAAQEVGLFAEAVEAFERCLALARLAAPSSEYELKYAMMLAQCLARWRLSAAPRNVPQNQEVLKKAMRSAEEAHDRLYGGGGRHFLTRMKRRLEDIYAALRR
ncbi:unnamed protein product [Effrenium voratum]|nr:unnamed protein product [Effrenium voratum]